MLVNETCFLPDFNWLYKGKFQHHRNRSGDDGENDINRRFKWKLHIPIVIIVQRATMHIMHIQELQETQMPVFRSMF